MTSCIQMDVRQRWHLEVLVQVEMQLFLIENFPANFGKASDAVDSEKQFFLKTSSGVVRQ